MRDLTARTRIRQVLQQVGSIEDPSGRATSLLMDAIGYQGSKVAFIQLIAAMDRDGQISREIEGKRTYAIRLEEAGWPSPVEVNAPVQSAAVLLPQGLVEIDYRKLARALVEELMLTPLDELRRAAARTAEEDVALLTAERDRLQAERNEFAQRLEAARAQMGDLFGHITQPTA